MKLHVSTDLDLPVDWMTMATVVYGARGTGKTTLGAVVAEELTRVHQRFCAIDLKGDLWGLKSTADGKGAGIPVVIFGGDHADLPLEAGAGRFLGELVAGLEQSVVLDFEHMSKGKQVRFLGEFFAALYEKNREPLLVIADEVQRYAPQKPLSPEASVCLGAVEDLVKLGRKHGIGVLLLTQRGAGLNKEVSEICDMLIVFRTPGSLDQGRAREWIQANGGDMGALDVVSGFADGQALVTSAHPELKISKTVQMRRRETFDSSKTPKVGERRKEPKRLAQPQLEAIKSQMSAAIQRQEANDPTKLQQTIKALQARLQKGSLAPGFVAIEETKLKELLKVPGRKVEVPVVEKEDLARLERAIEKLDKMRDASAQAQQVVASSVGNLRTLVEQTLKRLGDQPTPKLFLLGDQHTTHTTKAAVRKEHAVARAAVGGEPQEGLTRPRQRMLDVLAAFEALKVQQLRRNNLAVFSDQSPTSSGYGNNLGALRSLGYITYPTSDTAQLTNEGRAQAAPVEAPMTLDGLHQAWLGKLPPKRQAMVEVLIKAYPDAVPRDALAEATKQSPTSSGYGNNLGALRSLGIADYPSSDEVIATNLLFPPELWGR